MNRIRKVQPTINLFFGNKQRISKPAVNEYERPNLSTFTSAEQRRSDINLIPVQVVTAENSLKNNYSTSFVLVICWLKYI